LVPVQFDHAASCLAYSFCSIAMVLANKVPTPNPLPLGTLTPSPSLARYSV
jgi:hypothetical protein